MPWDTCVSASGFEFSPSVEWLCASMKPGASKKARPVNHAIGGAGDRMAQMAQIQSPSKRTSWRARGEPVPSATIAPLMVHASGSATLETDCGDPICAIASTEWPSCDDPKGQEQTDRCGATSVHIADSMSSARDPRPVDLIREIRVPFDVIREIRVTLRSG